MGVNDFHHSRPSRIADFERRLLSYGQSGEVAKRLKAAMIRRLARSPQAFR